MVEALSFSLVAGEASGDLLAGLLLGGMREKWPDMHSAGIGGPRMEAQGFEPWWPYEKLAVRGYVEVLRHYREIVAIRNQLREQIRLEREDAQHVVHTLTDFFYTVCAPGPDGGTHKVNSGNTLGFEVAL